MVGRPCLPCRQRVVQTNRDIGKIHRQRGSRSMRRMATPTQRSRARTPSRWLKEARRSPCDTQPTFRPLGRDPDRITWARGRYNEGLARAMSILRLRSVGSRRRSPSSGRRRGVWDAPRGTIARCHKSVSIDGRACPGCRGPRPVCHPAACFVGQSVSGHATRLVSCSHEVCAGGVSAGSARAAGRGDRQPPTVPGPAFGDCGDHRRGHLHGECGAPTAAAAVGVVARGGRCVDAHPPSLLSGGHLRPPNRNADDQCASAVADRISPVPVAGCGVVRALPGDRAEGSGGCAGRDNDRASHVPSAVGVHLR
jgi:hypothetical protein